MNALASLNHSVSPCPAFWLCSACYNPEPGCHVRVRSLPMQTSQRAARCSTWQGQNYFQTCLAKSIIQEKQWVIVLSPHTWNIKIVTVMEPQRHLSALCLTGDFGSLQELLHPNQEDVSRVLLLLVSRGRPRLARKSKATLPET